MEFLIMALIVGAVVAAISIIAHLRRIADATERSASALEELVARGFSRETPGANGLVTDTVID
jgi:hypothetical protein